MIESSPQVPSWIKSKYDETIKKELIESGERVLNPDVIQKIKVKDYSTPPSNEHENPPKKSSKGKLNGTGTSSGGDQDNGENNGDVQNVENVENVEDVEDVEDVEYIEDVEYDLNDGSGNGQDTIINMDDDKQGDGEEYDKIDSDDIYDAAVVKKGQHLNISNRYTNRKSIVEIDAKDIGEKSFNNTFETNRARYQLDRFLQNKDT